MLQSYSLQQRKLTDKTFNQQRESRFQVKLQSRKNLDVKAAFEPDISRKGILLKSVVLTSLVSIPSIFKSQSVQADTETPPYKEFYDKTLGYKYQYPQLTTSGKELNFFLSRKPERYSSAAPLSPDARQRIVSEMIDFKNAVTIAVYVGAPGNFLKDKNSEDWTPKEIIDSVLTDKSTSRGSKGDRVHFNQVKSFDVKSMNGQKYIVYKYSAEAPDMTAKQYIDLRYSYTSTTWRNGLNNTPYLYTINISSKEKLWNEAEQDFKKAAESFKLTEVDKNYVPPDKEPWRFF